MKVQKPEKNINFPSMEHKIADFWDRERIFKKSIENRPASKPFRFYDGPPFATGTPHFGHFIPSTIKDAVPRYFTMKGYRVERRFGWDCHGLPVEMLIQKEKNLNGRVDIEKMGIPAFNQACREAVLRCAQDWRAYMRRLGRWVDMDNEYKTMDLPFMESVWAVVKKLWDKGLVYEGRKVMSYSPALASTLSNFEASLDYRDVQDPSVTVKAKLTNGPYKDASFLVWTTTPWTLPANVAVAIDAKATYAIVKDKAKNEKYIVLESRVPALWKNVDDVEVLEKVTGDKFVGASYAPFYDYAKTKGLASDTCYKIYGVDYVLHDTGTGAVHTAPAFGEDDFRTSQKYNLPIVDHLDFNSKFLPGNMDSVVGLEFKEGDKLIIADLKQRGVLFKQETLNHAYPFCYRSGKPLMYRAMPSWFVSVEKIKETLLKTNQEIHWVPDHLKTGRFGKWLENARDWNIARERYWGNPIPIWKNTETGEMMCIGSVAELEKLSGTKVTDLHMEHIDHIEIPAPSGKGKLKRVPFVLDCWFESGSMPYAQLHYPFEKADEFESCFPADFICEGLDQTRGWFYTLHVLAGALFEKPAFKNVVVNGIILASDGRKMSKSLKNYPDPMGCLDEFGADSMRLFLLSSPATFAEEIKFSEEGVKEATRRTLLPLWNAYSFFTTYASIDGFDPEKDLVESDNELDRWVMLRLQQVTTEVDDAMRDFQVSKVVPAINQFLDDLNNWYIRRNRRRFWDSDKKAHSTLYKTLVTVTQLLAPFAPFLSDYLFSQLALTIEYQKAESVHLTLLPDAKNALSESDVRYLESIQVVRKTVELGRNIRTQHKLKVRQPLSEVVIGTTSAAVKQNLEMRKDVIAEELNVKSVKVTDKPADLAKVVVKPNLKILGKDLGAKLPDVRKGLETLSAAEAQKALLGQPIEVAGVTLDKERVIVELTASGKNLVAVDGEIVVALNPEISEELKWEGLAREVVSLVQKARKSAGFEVEDRVQLSLETSQELDAAIRNNTAYIQDETLSQLVKSGFKSEYSEECVIEGQNVKMHLARIQA